LYDKFDLQICGSGDKLLQGGMSIVAIMETPMSLVLYWPRMFKLRRDRIEVGVKVFTKDGSCCFNRDKVTSLLKPVYQHCEIWLQHRFAAADDNVLNILPLTRFCEDLVGTAFVARRSPRCVRRIAPDAA